VRIGALKETLLRSNAKMEQLSSAAKSRRITTESCFHPRFIRLDDRDLKLDRPMSESFRQSETAFSTSSCDRYRICVKSDMDRDSSVSTISSCNARCAALTNQACLSTEHFPLPRDFEWSSIDRDQSGNREVQKRRQPSRVYQKTWSRFHSSIRESLCLERSKDEHTLYLKYRQ
jgi:hypothetical protein